MEPNQEAQSSKQEVQSSTYEVQRLEEHADGQRWVVIALRDTYGGAEVLGRLHAKTYRYVRIERIDLIRVQSSIFAWSSEQLHESPF